MKIQSLSLFISLSDSFSKLFLSHPQQTWTLQMKCILTDTNLCMWKKQSETQPTHITKINWSAQTKASNKEEGKLDLKKKLFIIAVLIGLFILWLFYSLDQFTPECGWCRPSRGRERPLCSWRKLPLLEVCYKPSRDAHSKDFDSEWNRSRYFMNSDLFYFSVIWRYQIFFLENSMRKAVNLDYIPAFILMIKLNNLFKLSN